MYIFLSISLNICLWCSKYLLRVSDLVGNSKDKFSRNEVQKIIGNEMSADLTKGSFGHFSSFHVIKISKTSKFSRFCLFLQ